MRWPGPILAASVALALVGLLALPSYKPSYNDRNYLPDDIPANLGYAAADRHFPQARMNPEMLLVETDHDVRNSADMLVVDRIAKSIFHIPGVGRVQSITRPEGTPIEHTSIPFLISMQWHHPADEPGLHGQSHGEHADAGQRHADVHRHDGANAKHHGADGGHHAQHGHEDEGHDRRHRGIARQHRQFRRLLPSAAQLLLLGTALLRHPGLLVDQVDLRHPRRHRHDDR